MYSIMCRKEDFVRQAIIIIASLMMFFVLPKPSMAQSEKDQLSPEGLRTAILRYAEAWNTRDIPTIIALERDLIEFGTHGQKPRYKRGRSEQEFRRYLQDWSAGWQSIEWTLKDWDVGCGQALLVRRE